MFTVQTHGGTRDYVSVETGHLLVKTLHALWRCIIQLFFRSASILSSTEAAGKWNCQAQISSNSWLWPKMGLLKNTDNFFLCLEEIKETHTKRFIQKNLSHHEIRKLLRWLPCTDHYFSVWEKKPQIPLVWLSLGSGQPTRTTTGRGKVAGGAWQIGTTI